MSNATDTTAPGAQDLRKHGPLRDIDRWIQLLFGIVCMAMVANLQYGWTLVSRSQAKRLLARVELFKIVMFDFSKVPTIGQAFADEIFRVFANKHPDIELQTIHETSEVKRMVARARSGSAR